MNEPFKCRSSVHSEFETSDECELPTFGNPLGNHGWIKCNSKTFPGMHYYFNVDTSCSTWGRPVPRYIPTPYHRPLHLRTDEEFLDEPPIEVSDIEDDEDEDENQDLSNENVDEKLSNVSVKEARRKKIFAEVLFKLYHCCGEDFNINECGDLSPEPTTNELSVVKNESREDDESTDIVQSILPEICYSSSSDGESTDSESTENRQSSNSLGSVSTIIVNQRQNSETSLEKSEIFSECEGFGPASKDNCDLAHLLDPGTRIEDSDETSRMSVSSSEDCDEGSRLIGLSSSDDEEAEDDDEEETEDENDDGEGEGKEDDNNNAENDKCRYSLPRLKSIEFSDLITEPPKVRSMKKKIVRKRKPTKLIKTEENLTKSPPKKVTKIIYERNGVKTINYDYVAPELPAGVKMSNLSDSGSSAFHENWYSLYDTEKSEKNSIDTKIKVEKTFDCTEKFLNINEPDLSDSSTSKSSSSRKMTRKKILNISCGVNNNESDSSESSTTSSSATSSSAASSRVNGIKTILNTTCGKIECDTDSSESYSSSSSSSSSAKSLEKQIKKLPPSVSFTIKLEKLDTNEWSVANSSEKIVRKSARACANVQYVTFFDSDSSTFSQ